MSDETGRTDSGSDEWVKAELERRAAASRAEFGHGIIDSPNPEGLTLGQQIDDMGKALRAELIAAGELPPAGGTTAAQREQAADHATTVTIHEAAQRTGISVTTWRRRLRTGKVAGAFLAAGPKGEEWRIPVTALDTVTTLTVTPVVTPDAQAVADLQRRVTELETQLELQRALADERRQALDQLHATMRALGAGLAAPTTNATPDPTATGGGPRRRWWGRKPTP